MDETLAEPMIFEGVTHGTIAAGKVDSNKVYEMPYAPIFKPDGETKVMSDMSSLERAYDHRSQAVNQFIQFYKQHHL
jgi:inosine/xanthosine triphosphate pyrophosphatase family protein